jgi:hypothetical protein
MYFINVDFGFHSCTQVHKALQTRRSTLTYSPSWEHHIWYFVNVPSTGNKFHKSRKGFGSYRPVDWRQSLVKRSFTNTDLQVSAAFRFYLSTFANCGFYLRLSHSCWDRAKMTSDTSFLASTQLFIFMSNLSLNLFYKERNNFVRLCGISTSAADLRMR